MDPMVSGLRYRVRRAARQISDQHRHMSELRRRCDEALAGGGGEELREALLRYCGALDAHFALEEDVFFPALHGLRPEHTEELDALSREHEVFATRLTALRRCTETESGGDGVVASFQAFAEEMRQHEAREERLVRKIADLLGDPD
jgi:iron-sulfur cluster repair protein YtfE (RIC family)